MQLKILQGDDEKRNGIYYEYDPFSKPIGEGGMGVVFKGFRVNAATGGRQVVAIKAMKDGLPDEVYGRACREANIRLKNDNLVEMMGLITTIEQERGGRSIRRYYVVSEFLNGVVLTDLLKGAFKNHDGIEIPYAKQLYTDYISNRKAVAVDIAKRVLAGIMALHDRKFIHRDIDPSNIMVTAEGNLKIIDFGIAKYVGELGSQDTLRTSTGKFIGKAEYASPELVLGDVKNQHFTTDIYAIGILFYQLLVGDLPFKGTQYDIMQAQLHKKVPVSNVHYSEYRSIIKKATAKQQPDRYQSCVEMRMAIDRAHPGTDWKKVIGYAAMLIVVCPMFYIGYKFFNPAQTIDISTETTETTNTTETAIEELLPPPIDNLMEQFNEALAHLDSDDAKLAKQGWIEMKGLANQGYTKAINEVGLTYCSEEKFQTELIKKRRSNIKLRTEESLDSTRILLMGIKDSEDISPEALAVLGISLYRKGYEKTGAIPNIDISHEVFKKAKERITKVHPWSKVIEDYIGKSDSKTNK